MGDVGINTETPSTEAQDLFESDLGFKIRRLGRVAENLENTAFTTRNRGNVWDVMCKNIVIAGDIPWEEMAEKICERLNTVITMMRMGIKKSHDRLCQAVNDEIGSL